MSNQNPMDVALSAIPLPQSVADKVKNKTTVTISAHEEGGWGSIPISTKLTYHNKPDPDSWNQIDLQWYLKNRYADKYGVQLNIPLLAGHQAIKTIKFGMFKKLGYEPKHSVIKDYFDFCIDRHADEIIKSQGVFTIHKITKPVYILDYLDKTNIGKVQQAVPARKVEQTAPAVESSAAVEPLTMDDLTTAFRINSQYMVSNYGIIIPVNFLVAVKNKTLDEAIAYVQGAMTKLAAKGQQEMSAVITSTNKYQPYPSWLRFTDVSKIVKMTIAVSDDNPVFRVFKELK